MIFMFEHVKVSGEHFFVIIHILGIAAKKVPYSICSDFKFYFTLCCKVGGALIINRIYGISISGLL